MPYYKHTRKKFSVWRFLPNVTLSIDRHVNGFLDGLPEGAVIVDIGSGGRLLAPGVIAFDKFVTANTKVIGDIHNLPFGDESIDSIVCTGTLEHIEDPWAASKEFRRVLKKGGRVFVAVPFMQGYHPDPADYWRFTEEGLIRLMQGFERLESGPVQGTGSGLSWAINDFFRSLSDNKYVSELLGIMARFLFFWVKYLDIPLRGKRNRRLFSGGFFFIGEKA